MIPGCPDYPTEEGLLDSVRAEDEHILASPNCNGNGMFRNPDNISINPWVTSLEVV